MGQDASTIRKIRNKANHRMIVQSICKNLLSIAIGLCVQNNRNTSVRQLTYRTKTTILWIMFLLALLFVKKMMFFLLEYRFFTKFQKIESIHVFCERNNLEKGKRKIKSLFVFSSRFSLYSTIFIFYFPDKQWFFTAKQKDFLYISVFHFSRFFLKSGCE